MATLQRSVFHQGEGLLEIAPSLAGAQPLLAVVFLNPLQQLDLDRQVQGLAEPAGQQGGLVEAALAQAQGRKRYWQQQLRAWLTLVEQMLQMPRQQRPGQATEAAPARRPRLPWSRCLNLLIRVSTGKA